MSGQRKDFLFFSLKRIYMREFTSFLMKYLNQIFYIEQVISVGTFLGNPEMFVSSFISRSVTSTHTKCICVQHLPSFYYKTSTISYWIIFFKIILFFVRVLKINPLRLFPTRRNFARGAEFFIVRALSCRNPAPRAKFRLVENGPNDCEKNWYSFTSAPCCGSNKQRTNGK